MKVLSFTNLVILLIIYNYVIVSSTIGKIIFFWIDILWALLN